MARVGDLEASLSTRPLRRHFPGGTLKVAWTFLAAAATLIGLAVAVRTVVAAASPGRRGILAAGVALPSEVLGYAAAKNASNSAEVYPVRLLLFRHGFSCSNANERAGCREGAPILHLSPQEQTKFFDRLDAIGGKVAAPKPLPPIDREFGIDKATCTVRPQPPANRSQWSQAGDAVHIFSFYRDPLLTACSAFQTERAGEAFRAWLKHEGIKLDFLGASPLSRTFQTAYHQLLSEPEAFEDIFSREVLETGHRAPLVSQLPFVNEFDPSWGYQADNSPWPREEQRQRVVAALGKKATQHLDYSLLSGFTEEERTSRNWEAFKERLLSKRLLPLMLKRRGQPVPEEAPQVRSEKPFQREAWGHTAKLAAGTAGKVRPVLNIAMASHWGVIANACGFDQNDMIFNNAVLELVLLVEVREHGHEVLVRQSECVTVMTGLDYPEKLAMHDMANCKYPFDITQSNADSGEPSGKRTACEQAALGKDVFSTSPAAKFHLEE